MTRNNAESLLVNYWYANPIGHAVEGLRYCLGYHRANPDLRISLLLNGSTATELASFCPFVEATYAVDFGFFDDDRDPARALADIPRDWDYVVDEPRARVEYPLAAFENLRRFYAASDDHFRARAGHTVAGAAPPPYEPHEQLRLDLPPAARERAGRELGDAPVRIALMPAGSGKRSEYPSVKSWVSIVKALSAVYPNACFCLVGKHARDLRTTTRIKRAEVDRIAASCPAAVDAFDRPLAEQLALVESCQLFLSPHTGFGLAALAVGTPWLTVSGGRWHEYFFNGVPFYSVLPDPLRYPGFARAEASPTVAKDEDGEGERALNMRFARIRDDLPELVEAAQVLIEKRLPYEEALRLYFPRLLAAYGGLRSRIGSFDAIHQRYL